MKKTACILISAFLVIALAVTAWLWAYHHRKSNDNLPSLASLSQMGEEEITDLLIGYRQAQLHEVWGSPMVLCSECLARFGSWTVPGSMFTSTMAAQWSWQGCTQRNKERACRAELRHAQFVCANPPMANNQFLTIAVILTIMSIRGISTSSKGGTYYGKENYHHQP